VEHTCCHLHTTPARTHCTCCAYICHTHTQHGALVRARASSFCAHFYAARYLNDAAARTRAVRARACLRMLRHSDGDGRHCICLHTRHSMHTTGTLPAAYTRCTAAISRTRRCVTAHAPPPSAHGSRGQDFLSRTARAFARWTTRMLYFAPRTLRLPRALPRTRAARLRTRTLARRRAHARRASRQRAS